MKLKYFIFVFLILMLVGSVSAYSPHKIDTSYDLVIQSNNATGCNVTSITQPNNTRLDLDNEMTKDGNEFYFTIDGGNFSSVGETCIYITCTDGSIEEVGSKCLDVNNQGFQTTTGQGMIYVVSMFIVFLLFLLSLYFSIVLPYKNERTPTGNILYIEWKKYAKFSLWIVTYLILIFFFAIGKGMSFAFLESTELFGFFNVGFIVLLIGFLPIVLLASTFFIFSLILDKKIQNMLIRGLPAR